MEKKIIFFKLRTESRALHVVKSEMRTDLTDHLTNLTIYKFPVYSVGTLIRFHRLSRYAVRLEVLHELFVRLFINKPTVRTLTLSSLNERVYFKGIPRDT